MALNIAIDTKEKRNLAILLGLMAALVVGVLVIYVVLPAVSGGDDEPPTVAKATKDAAGDAPAPAAKGPSAAAAAGTATTGAAPAPAVPAAAPAAATSVLSTTRVSMPFGRPREDPFEQHFVRIPAPPPDYEPPRPPPGPVPLPPPGNISVAPLPLPGAGAGSVMIGLQRPPVLATLPPVQIPQLNVAPSAPRFQPGTTPQTGVVSRATSRRVSGVLIGDSVRAILEIGEGEQKVTRIVQPGDEVDGIKILRIERIREGTRVITRMIISEAGEERFVELSPSTEPQAVAPGGGAFAPPGGGAFGGAPGGGAPAGGGNPFGGGGNPFGGVPAGR